MVKKINYSENRSSHLYLTGAYHVMLNESFKHEVQKTKQEHKAEEAQYS